MSQSKVVAVKFTPEEMAYYLPAEVEVKRVRRVGFGTETVRRLADQSKRMVGLDADVARVFKDSESVNAVLRAIVASVPSMRSAVEE